ncbi:MAG: hypothetical protein R3F41_14545 [Gammaproteobacteria bacterium]|nr:methylamine utilization protein [Pseudomonadales bacterium]MCP5347197.1 hypothetical protein [Pseudomonadales bacterium]
MKLTIKILLIPWLSIGAATLYGETLTVSLLDLRSESGLYDAVVEIIPIRQMTPEVMPIEVSVDQVDKEFISDVTVVPVGSRINFPNSDEILHHVYSFSQTKSFDIPLYGAGDNLDHFETFDRPGVVVIGCNIHDWMLAYIYVAESALVSKSDELGKARLENLEPGHYQLKIWHARMGDDPPLIKEVDVAAGLDTNLTIALDLAPERRIRRAPSSTSGRYR